MADRLPHEVVRDIEAIVQELRELGAEYQQAREALVKAEIRYEREMASQFVALYNMSKQSGERLPGEDVRRALAHKAVPDEVWSNFLASKAKVDAMDRVFRIHQSALSGLQSELGLLKQEIQLAGTDF